MVNGMSLQTIKAANAQGVIDECLGHVESRELVDMFKESLEQATKKGYFNNSDLDRLLYVGTSCLAGVTMAERHALAQDEDGVWDDAPEKVHQLHKKFLWLVDAAYLLPLAEKVYQTNLAIAATL